MLGTQIHRGLGQDGETPEPLIHIGSPIWVRRGSAHTQDRAVDTPVDSDMHLSVHRDTHPQDMCVTCGGMSHMCVADSKTLKYFPYFLVPSPCLDAPSCSGLPGTSRLPQDSCLGQQEAFKGPVPG